jgi:hypothetical protein
MKPGIVKRDYARKVQGVISIIQQVCVLSTGAGIEHLDIPLDAPEKGY